MQPIEQLGPARRQLGDQRLNIAQHRRHGEGEKHRGRGSHAQQQKKNRQPTAGMPAPDVQPHDSAGHRCQHHGKQGTYIEQQ